MATLESESTTLTSGARSVCRTSSAGFLGAWSTGWMFGVCHHTSRWGEVQNRQECDGVLQAFICKDMVKYGLVGDTGRRAALGYHRDCRMMKILFPFEDFGSLAPPPGDRKKELGASCASKGIAFISL